MHSSGKRAEGERLERMQASPLWRDGGFRNQYSTLPTLRDILVPVIPIQEFLVGGERCKPNVPQPSLDPLQRMDSHAQPSWRRTRPRSTASLRS